MMHGGSSISSETSQITTNGETLSWSPNSPRRLICLPTLPPTYYHSKPLSAEQKASLVMPHYLSRRRAMAELEREMVGRVKVGVRRVRASYTMDVERRDILSRNVETRISWPHMLQRRSQMLMLIWLQLNWLRLPILSHFFSQLSKRTGWSQSMWPLKSNLPTTGSLTLVQQITSPEIVTSSSPFISGQKESIRSRLQTITSSMLKELEWSHSTSTDQVRSQQSSCSNTHTMCLLVAPIIFSVSSSWWGKEWTSSSIWTEQLQVLDQYLSTKLHWSTVYSFPEPLLSPHGLQCFMINWMRSRRLRYTLAFGRLLMRKISLSSMLVSVISLWQQSSGSPILSKASNCMPGAHRHALVRSV